MRTVQATGHEETWAPTLRAGPSFLAQSGSLTGLRDLSRGLTVDVIPTVTSSAVGAAGDRPVGLRRNRPELGGSVRWGITSNLTLSGTANPDFSQVEADATQFTVRSARPGVLPGAATVLPREPGAVLGAESPDLHATHHTARRRDEAHRTR